MASGAQPADLKHNRPKCQLTIKQRRRLRKVVPLCRGLMLKKIKEIVRQVTFGMCLGHSIVLYSTLIRLGDRPKIMGVWFNAIDYLRSPICPEHYYVESPRYGTIDIYPEGFRFPWGFRHEADMKYLFYRIIEMDYQVDMVMKELGK